MYAEIMKCPETGAAFVKKLKDELKVCRNELCLKCGSYREAHKGACDGCRWQEK
jgi:hypothetical protein